MLVDCHMHTPLCGHAFGEPIEYAETARDRGIDLITVTCHIPMEWEPFGQSGIRMARNEVDDYIRLVGETAAKAKEFGVEVLCGIEAEIFPDEAHMRSMDEVLAAYEFDFVLGSLHAQCRSYLMWLDENGAHDDHTRADYYFRHLTEGVRSGRYDSLSHPDVIRTYGVVDYFEPEDHEAVVRELLAAVVEMDKCIEVNTSGLNKGAFEVHPDPLILDWANEMGVKLTLGSDSHRPESVGQHFDEVLPLLRKKGFDRIHYFRGRKREVISI